MLNEANESLIEIAKDVALRWAIHADAATTMSSLYVRVCRAITWRTVLHSENAAEAVLDHLAAHGVSVAVIIDLTSSFLYRSGLVDPVARDDAADKLSKSVTWASKASELNKLIAGLSARDSTAFATFQTCPWMMFLYLFSMSDFIDALDAKKIPAALPKAE